MTTERGMLYLVVGPSGSGKDSLISCAKSALVGNGQYIFPRRYITRPANAGGESHIPVSSKMFETMQQRGELLLEWHAHNYRYGVPVAVQEHLEQGRNVIVNVSRTVVDEARQTLQPMKVLYINVAEEVLEERLRARGRESVSDIKRRVDRAHAYQVEGEDVIMIDNDGTLETSVTSFLDAIAVQTHVDQ